MWFFFCIYFQKVHPSFSSMWNPSALQQDTQSDAIASTVHVCARRHKLPWTVCFTEVQMCIRKEHAGHSLHCGFIRIAFNLWNWSLLTHGKTSLLCPSISFTIRTGFTSVRLTTKNALFSILSAFFNPCFHICRSFSFFWIS